jgi:hypothetical protein
MERQPHQATLDDDAPNTNTTVPNPDPPTPPPEANTTSRPTQSSLSISEPTLRFPRPTVNQHLASWISSSQPDIMSPSSHPVEDSGLSESTYEFITTDDESQDGIATESLQSFGESRPDDVRSLAGSERSESGIDTDSESEDEEHDEDDEEEEQNEEDTRSQASSIQYTEETLNSPSPRLPTHSDVLSLDDETVHLSVESTLKAGETPPSDSKPFGLASIVPGFENIRRSMASMVIERDGGGEESDSFVTRTKKLAMDLRQNVHDSWREILLILLRIFSWVLVALMVGSTITNLRLYQAESAPADVIATTSTVVATTSVQPASDTINLTTSTSTALQIPRVNALTTNSAIIPFSNLLPDIAPDAAKVPVCSAGIHSTNEILIKMPLSTKTTWLAKDSITIDVLRDGQAVKTRFSSIDEGLIIEIPYREAHGIINVRVVTSRRPKVNETFEVDFGTTLLGKALSIADVVKVKTSETADEVGKRATAAGESIVSGVKGTSGWVGSEMASTTDYLKTVISKEKAMATETWKQAQLGVKQARHQLQDSADLAQLNILRAQITSRLWWLKMQFKTAEADAYKLKAKTHLAEQYANLRRAMQERRTPEKVAECQPTGFWARHKCAGSAPRS